MLKRLGFCAGALLLALAVPAAAQHDAARVSASNAAPLKKAKLPRYTPEPALWLLSDEDTKIYLFGTIHVLPRELRWRSGAVKKAMKEADELVVETYVEPDKEFGQSMSYLASALLVKPQPILERVPEDKRAALKARIDKTVFPIAAYDRMQSWLAAMLLAPDLWAGAEVTSGAEDVLEKSFREAKKPISSVEDGRVVLGRFSGVSAESQAKMLVDAVDALDRRDRGEPEKGDDLDLVAWASGRPDEIGDLDKDLPPEVYKVLLTDRNAAWSGWLEERLKKPGTVFFAVGAGHLTGRDSVQTMLEARGLKAVRVK